MIGEKGARGERKQQGKLPASPSSGDQVQCLWPQEWNDDWRLPREYFQEEGKIPREVSRGHPGRLAVGWLVGLPLTRRPLSLPHPFPAHSFACSAGRSFCLRPATAGHQWTSPGAGMRRRDSRREELAEEGSAPRHPSNPSPPASKMAHRTPCLCSTFAEQLLASRSRHARSQVCSLRRRLGLPELSSWLPASARQIARLVIDGFDEEEIHVLDVQVEAAHKVSVSWKLPLKSHGKLLDPWP